MPFIPQHRSLTTREREAILEFKESHHDDSAPDLLVNMNDRFLGSSDPGVNNNDKKVNQITYFPAYTQGVALFNGFQANVQLVPRGLGPLVGDYKPDERVAWLGFGAIVILVGGWVVKRFWGKKQKKMMREGGEDRGLHLA
ncbi:hypothetical protein CKM354_000840900 [Cercospora kikuchii]|uniref:Uncharacterized protein n=1 Tax=Cercospora kikuchii TaxID=84275 RepID=A0A9P3CRE5_9PEZI|nr:uncharacterized protein CKM354_000840900 [Cercospora kikuchii]GIZ45230.1 hypothetical protein CKM354_000840900 [Cercospora kikuchii]